MLTNEQKQKLIKRWSNDTKRKKFAANYRKWGIWFKQPELGLVFYKFDLPDGNRLIAMEYCREPDSWEKEETTNKYIVSHKLYLQIEKYFKPSSTSDTLISNHLKELKANLLEELKNDA